MGGGVVEHALSIQNGKRIGHHEDSVGLFAIHRQNQAL
jgi:hypothetical protein